MKFYLLGFIISFLAFLITAFLLPGLNYHGNSTTLLEAGGIFSVLNLIVRPILKILLMPLNFLTMGFLGGISGLILLWLLTVVYPAFSLTDTHFPGYALLGISIPSYDLNVFLTTIIGATVISLISSTLYWLTR